MAVHKPVSGGDQVARRYGPVVRIKPPSGGGPAPPAGMTVYSDTYANIPDTCTAGDLFLPTDAYQVFRCDGTDWMPWGPAFHFTAPPTTGWSWDNQGTSTVAEEKDGVYLLGEAAAAAQIHGRYRTAPSVPYVITAAIIPSYSTMENNNTFGIYFRQSSDGKCHSFERQANTSASFNAQFLSTKWTDATTISANYTTQSLGHSGFPVYWFQIEDDNTNRICRFSRDGQHWIEIHSVGRTDFLTADQVGFCVRPRNATWTIGALLISWTED